MAIPASLLGEIKFMGDNYWKHRTFMVEYNPKKICSQVIWEGERRPYGGSHLSWCH